MKRVRRTGLIRQETTLYGLRHASCTRMIVAGVPLPTVAKVHGHLRIQTTMTYIHVEQTELLQDALRQAFAGERFPVGKVA